MRVRSKPDVGKRLYDGCWHQDISPSTEYVVLSVNYGDYRLAGDSDDPCLYPSEMFELTDDSIPSDWIFDLREDWCALGPREFLQPGFWEDVHDGKEAALATYRRLHDKLVAEQDAGVSKTPIVPLRRSDCQATLVFEFGPYEECHVECETPTGLLFRLTDEPSDGEVVFEFVSPQSGEARIRLPLSDLEQVLADAKSMLTSSSGEG